MSPSDPSKKKNNVSVIPIVNKKRNLEGELSKAAVQIAKPTEEIHVEKPHEGE